MSAWRSHEWMKCSRASRAAPRMPASSPSSARTILIWPSGSVMICVRAAVRVESFHGFQCNGILGGNRLGEVPALESPTLASHLIAEHRGNALLNRLVDSSLDRRLARHRFHAAMGAATALWTVGLDDRMADLAGVSGRAGDDLAAQDDAAADARAHEGRDQVPVAAPGTQPEFGVSCHAYVVLDENRPVKISGKLRTNRIILHVEIGAEENHSGLDIERTGRANSARHDVLTWDSGAYQGLVHARDHLLEDCRATVPGRRVALAAPQDPVLGADHAGQCFRPAQVNTDHGRSTPLPCHDLRSEPLFALAKSCALITVSRRVYLTEADSEIRPARNHDSDPGPPTPRGVSSVRHSAFSRIALSSAASTVSCSIKRAAISSRVSRWPCRMIRALAWASSMIRRTSRSISRAVCSLQDSSAAVGPFRPESLR